MKSFIGLVLALLCGLYALVAGADRPNTPVLTVERDRLVAANFTPGATVVAVCICMEAQGAYSSTSMRVMRLTDTSRVGTIVFPLRNPANLRSVWIAIDERAGDVATASPRGFSPLQGEPPGLRKRNDVLDAIDWPAHAAYLVYVHPGKAILVGFANDATPADGKSRGNYTSSFALSELKPLLPNNTDKPVDIKPGGTLLLVDAFDLRTTSVKVDGAMIGGAK